MANNYVQDGGTMEFTAAADIKSGDPVVIGAIVVVALANAMTGELCVGRADGVFDLPKGAGAIGQGEKVYLTSGGNITKTASGNTAAGICWIAAEDADASVAVKLNR
ncbi:DUF2190 family protein [Endozoicomonas lisbonensis]|uniref:RecA/RadA family phage recombinase n=1 Tax=Endozoicomonas lisbonensis TaxID=3120522 RepID=A0ABV2SFH3_9GAMM